MAPPPPPPLNLKLQLRRDGIFYQAGGRVCAFPERLLAALSYRYNSNGGYEESSRDASRKWLGRWRPQASCCTASLLSPAP